MSDRSAIEWTDATWNPVTGCTKVSPGCDHCYAERFAERWRGTPGHYFERGFDVMLRPDKLEEPTRWRKPRRVFVNSIYPIGPERGSGGRAGAESELWVTLDISGAYVGETPNGGSRRLTYSVYSGRDCCL